MIWSFLGGLPFAVFAKGGLFRSFFAHAQTAQTHRRSKRPPFHHVLLLSAQTSSRDGAHQESRRADSPPGTRSLPLYIDRLCVHARSCASVDRRSACGTALEGRAGLQAAIVAARPRPKADPCRADVSALCGSGRRAAALLA